MIIFKICALAFSTFHISMVRVCEKTKSIDFERFEQNF